ncbi:MAG: PAAR domain-containing protein [Candidatus Poseidoniales archaeon]|jgi:uncharacterized Zn-binding protein involved in type VI secretion
MTRPVILSNTAGEFTFITDEGTVTYDNYNDIPQDLDYNTVQKFLPEELSVEDALPNLNERNADWNGALTHFIQESSTRKGGPPACRGDAVDLDVTHCSTPARLERSPDVFVNKIGWSRQGDLNTVHLGPACAPHQAPITLGSPTVFVNGRGAGRIGDAVTACTQVATGSPNVFCGP